MIGRLAYVICDVCGNPAQPASDNSVAEARAIARCEGFVREHRHDLCPRCALRGAAMSRTHRKHLSLSRLARRGPKREGNKHDLKTPKQRRSNERTRLRKDYR